MVNLSLQLQAEVYSEVESKCSTWWEPKGSLRKALGQLVACLLQLVKRVLKLLEALKDCRSSKSLHQVNRCSRCEA